MTIPASPFQDPAVPVLQGAPIDDVQKADLHDIFHNSKDENELAQRLQPLVVPDQVKSDLYEAKKRFRPAGDVLEKGFAVIDRLGGIDQAESHPKIATALIQLAAKEAEKQAQTAQDESGENGKGKQASSTASAAGAPLAPRPDGLPHLPTIPENHYRVMTSDGAMHDIPADKIDEARQRDPLLHVLNP